MINRFLLICSFFSLFGISSLQSAQFALFNLALGPGPSGDTLWANANGTLMGNTGIVTIGYFNTVVVDSDIDTISELVSQLGVGGTNFTAVQTSTPNVSDAKTQVAPEFGYIGNNTTSGGTFSPGNPLLGRRIYTIATSAASLGTATTSDAFSLFFVTTIVIDQPTKNTYIGNPAGITPIIGTNSVIMNHTSATFGLGNYNTLRMAVIPEPSTFLLSSLGVFALLRRRR